VPKARKTSVVPKARKTSSAKPDRLDKYRSMRDFEKTAEPSGVEPPPPSDAPRFVVQEHHATALHWDFRLEHDGVLVSWAVPMGIPPDPRENHLAVHTEDHPMSYIDFEGDIPEGSYGGGKVILWDRGTYDVEKFEDDEVLISLHGDRVSGRYVLFRTRGRDWMIHRMDPPADPTREPMPSGWHPMTASVGAMPEAGSDFAFEPEWSGLRVLVASKGGRARAEDPSGDDVSRFFPELRPFGRALGAIEVILDGVLVLEEDAMQKRLARKTDSAITRAANNAPAVFMAFDVVWLEGHATGELPFTERRRLLHDLELKGAAWQTTPSIDSDGAAMASAAAAQGLRGIVAKRRSSSYSVGERSPDWIVVRS
jgi:bifunctional non-homologous end joining protein LigD